MADQDKKLRAELFGILAWIVRGCLDWHSEGLGGPEEVRIATDTYRSDMDTLAAFIEERCVVNPRATVGSTRLWNEYQQWADDNGEYPGTQPKLGLRLKERGFVNVKSGTVFWQGIRLKYPGTFWARNEYDH